MIEIQDGVTVALTTTFNEIVASLKTAYADASDDDAGYSLRAIIGTLSDNHGYELGLVLEVDGHEPIEFWTGAAATTEEGAELLASAFMRMWKLNAEGAPNGGTLQ